MASTLLSTILCLNLVASVSVSVLGERVTETGAGGERHPGEPPRTSGQSVQKSDKQNAPARHKATQAHETTNSFMYCQISHPPPD